MQSLNPYPSFENLRLLYNATESQLETFSSKYKRAINIVSCEYVAPSRKSVTYTDEGKNRDMYAGLSIRVYLGGIGIYEIGSRTNITSKNFEYWVRNVKNPHGHFTKDLFEYLDRILERNTTRERNLTFIQKNHKDLSDPQIDQIVQIIKGQNEDEN